ncbi:MAG TPA: hypothetical protein DCR14_18855, partial [Acidimicrobiaceae bacterium]|nr:hypothetical protein [Acidimicrobiaceae bacterium]
SAADLRLLFDLLAGPAGASAAVWRLELPIDAPETLHGLRLGAWLDDPALECDAEMVSVLQAATAAAEAAGALIDRSVRPSINVDRMWKLGARLIGAAVSVHGDDRGLTHQRWLLMDRERVALRQAWAEVFDHVDVLLCPVTLTPAFPHQQELAWDTRSIAVNGRHRRYLELEGWPALVGAAYLPSTSTPVGRTAAGLPVGVQVVAPMYHDRRAIAVADALTRAIGGDGAP